MDEENHSEGKSLFETPTWAVATVITGMVIIGTIVNRSLEQIKTWFASSRRKALLSALEKIKEELMLFGLLSLLMCHWTIWISKICVKSSSLSSRFFPCTVEAYETTLRPHKLLQISNFQSLNHSVFMKVENVQETHLSTHELCPEGHEPFASYESLEQLHRLLFVLGVIHVTYNFVTIVLAMVKIHSWKTWESQALSMADEGLKGTGKRSFKRLSTFVFHHTSHPWSKDRVLVWLLCFSRQFWSSINRADYMALRLGFLTNHELHPSYDFHSYMLRSLDDEFRDIVGISVPLWVYAIFCIFINFHGTYAYFWLSFTPAILILLVGTKLHHIVVKLALEVEDSNPCSGNQFNLRDELFWFGKPKLLLWLIQLISFQNAFEMATFIWSLWEIRGPSCFMENRLFLVIRLISGITFQFWCSFITFPLYVIVTQMGSKFKKSVVSENIRESLKEWQNRAKNLKQNQEKAILSTETSCASTESTKDETDRRNGHPSSSILTSSIKPVILTEGENCEISPDDPEVSHSSGLTCDSSESSDEDDKSRKDEYSFLPL